MDSDRLRKRAELIFWGRSKGLLKDGPPASPAEMKALYAQCLKDAQRELALDDMLGTLETAAAGGLLVATLEYKDVPPDDWYQTKSGDDSDNSVAGYGAVFNNLDLTKDIIEPGAFLKTLGDARQFARAHGTDTLWPLLWQHEREAPIGSITGAYEDGHGLRVNCRIDRSIEPGRAAYNGLKGGYLSFSIGYRPTRYEWKGRVRHLQEISLAEISAVTFPANPEARAVIS